jgi:hypothetical protein
MDGYKYSYSTTNSPSPSQTCILMDGYRSTQLFFFDRGEHPCGSQIATGLQNICKLFANCYIALAKTEHHLEPIAASSRGSRADDRHNFGSRIDEGSPNYGGRTSMAMVPLHRRSMWPAGVCCTHARGCRSPFMRSNYYGCVTSVQAQS